MRRMSARQDDGLIADEARFFVDRLRVDAAHLGIGLRPCDEEGCSDGKAVEAEEIHIAAVHDVERTGLRD